MATVSTTETGNSITFPMTLDYWASWSISRGIAEAVANAFDETENVGFEWKDGWLTITDDGPGMPRQGLLLGFSTKRSNGRAIGQFGEGLCASMLIAARTGTTMVLDTAGYTVTPDAVDDPDLGARVLRITFGPSERKSGTVVRFKVAEKTAEAVHKRFLRFAPGYVAPEGAGRIVDGPGGRLYIGGVIVREGSKHCFSYDLGLERNKKLQNRDRTTVDEWAVSRSIQDIVGEVRDPKVLIRLIEAGEADKCHESELHMARHDPEAKRALATTREMMFKDALVAVASDADSNLTATYQGYRVLAERGANSWALRAIYESMGIPTTSAVAGGLLNRKEKARNERVKGETFVSEKKLTEAQAENLRHATELLERAFGRDCLGRVRPYTGSPLGRSCSDSTRLGFYRPHGAGVIGILVAHLDDREGTVATLFHELAHRRAHRLPNGQLGRDYGDRSIGFERMLESMGTQLLLTCAAGNALPLIAEATVVLPNVQAGALVKQRLRERKYTQASAAKAAFVEPWLIGKAVKGATVVHRSSMVSLCDLLGLDGDILTLLLAAPGVKGAARYRKNGHIQARLIDKVAREAMAILETRRDDLRSVVAEIRRFYDMPLDLTTEQFFAPYYALLDCLDVAQKTDMREAARG